MNNAVRCRVRGKMPSGMAAVRVVDYLRNHQAQIHKKLNLMDAALKIRNDTGVPVSSEATRSLLKSVGIETVRQDMMTECIKHLDNELVAIQWVDTRGHTDSAEEYVRKTSIERRCKKPQEETLFKEPDDTDTIKIAVLTLASILSDLMDLLKLIIMEQMPTDHYVHALHNKTRNDVMRLISELDAG